jgi:nitroreductase
MTRSFDTRPVPDEVIERMVDLATRAPSAGKTQGWHLIVLTGADTARFWDISLAAESRPNFRWKRLLDAPVIAIPLADPDAYLARYSEPDKAASGLGEAEDAWPTPYWTVDASMSVMTLLLAAEDEGLGALLFGIFNDEAGLRAAFGIPDRLQILGAIALGWPTPDDAADQTGLSARRPRRRSAEVIHRGGW